MGLIVPAEDLSFSHIRIWELYVAMWQPELQCNQPNYLQKPFPLADDALHEMIRNGCQTSEIYFFENVDGQLTIGILVPYLGEQKHLIVQEFHITFICAHLDNGCIKRLKMFHGLNICMLGNFACFFFVVGRLTFSQNLSVIPIECQSVKIQSRSNILSPNCLQRLLAVVKTFC